MEDLIAALEKAGTAPVSDALGRAPGIAGLTPIHVEKPVAGPAYTVETSGSNWLPIAKAVEEAPPGSVIVARDCDPQGAVWGELMTRSAMARGVKAAVIYGYTRDTMEIRELGFTLYSLGTNPRAGTPREGGRLQAEIHLGGAKVRPGDIVVVDQDGVVVVPREKLEEAAKGALRVLELEERVRSAIRSGLGLYAALTREGLLGKIG